VRVNQTAATTYGQQATARDNAKKTHQDLASKWYLERKKQCVAEKPTYGELQSISDSEIESVTSEKLPHARLARDKDGKPERDEEKRLLYIHIIESLITFKGGEQCAPHWKYKSHKIDDVTKEDLLAGREGKFFLCQLKAGKDRLKGKTYEEQQKLEGRDVKIYHGPVNRPEKLRERLDGLEARDLALQQANTQDAPGRGGRH
ncbi:MAG TPA: hypothetical protein VM532_11460, partial [Burkholderiales bacterium]|nr:hypothetical protein [Burkholderiales bacterium]